MNDDYLSYQMSSTDDNSNNGKNTPPNRNNGCGIGCVTFIILCAICVFLKIDTGNDIVALMILLISVIIGVGYHKLK